MLQRLNGIWDGFTTVDVHSPNRQSRNPIGMHISRTSIRYSLVAWYVIAWCYAFLARKSPPLQCVQSAGDAIFVPDGWSHATINVEAKLGPTWQCHCFTSEDFRRTIGYIGWLEFRLCFRLVPAPHNSVWHAWVFQWVYVPQQTSSFLPKIKCKKTSNIIKHHQPSSTIINHHQPSISWTIHNFYKLRVHWFTPPLAISYHPNATMCHFQDPRGGLAAHHVRDQHLHFGPGLLVPGTGLFDRGEVPGKQISPGTSPWQPKMRVLICEHAELIDHDLSNIYQIGFVSGKLMGYAKNMQVSWWTGWSTMQFWGSQFWDNPIYGEKIWDRYGSKSAYFFGRQMHFTLFSVPMACRSQLTNY